MKRKIFKSVFYAICVSIIIITSLSSCRGGGAKGAAAAAAAHALNEIVDEYESSESETGSRQISFQGAQTGYTGECKVEGCDCEGGVRTATGKCSNCPHSRTDHKWHN